MPSAKFAPRSSALLPWESIRRTSTATWGLCSARPDLFAVYVKVAHEYKLPFLAVHRPRRSKRTSSMLSSKDILLDSVVMAYPSVHASRTGTLSTPNAIKNLKPGLTEIIVHLGHDDAELQAVTLDHADYGAAWRQRDYDVVTSPEFKKAPRRQSRNPDPLERPEEALQ